MLLALALAAPAFSNPPPPSQFAVPDVHVIRVTDADVHTKTGNLRLMFEILNWTDSAVDQVVLIENDAGSLIPATAGGLPVIAAASVEFDGRPLNPLAGPADDDANFPPQDCSPCTDPDKIGASNSFSAGMPSTTKVVYTSDGSIPPRDLLGAADANAACALVPGCTAAGNPIADVERIDNGLSPDNVLDGFVLEFTDFDVGEVISFNVFLIDELGEVIGYHDGADFVGNAFGFGTINIFRGDGLPTRSHGPPVWTRPGRGAVIGNTGTVDPPDNLRDMFVQNDFFQVEVGAALTAPFRNSTDNDLLGDGGGVGVNAIPHPNVPVELMSFTVE